MPTRAKLQALCASIAAAQVTWLPPALKEEVRQTIGTVAAQQAGPDHLLPSSTGYRLIAAWTEGRTAPFVAPPPSSPNLPQSSLPVAAYNPWLRPQSVYAAIAPVSYSYRALLPLPATAQR